MLPIEHTLLGLFAWLLIMHALCDYPLQGDFLAMAKNHLKPVRGVPWYQAMAAHCLIQAGGVWFVTRSWELALLEFCVHFLIDVWKNDTSTYASQKSIEAGTAYNVDQLLHVVCKVLWVFILGMGWLR